MAWDALGEDEYSGDRPMDAFAGALSTAAAACMSELGRLPRLAEIVEAFEQALTDAPAGTVRNVENLARLEELRQQAANAVPIRERSHPKAGDLLAIPYAGEKAVYGWVLFEPSGGGKAFADLGICILVLDRDVRAGEDLDDVVRAAALLGPVHPNDTEIREGLWRIVGHVPGDFEAMLPRFESFVSKEGKLVRVLLDYRGNELSETPDNRARLRASSGDSARSVMYAVRALRGDARWNSAFDTLLPKQGTRK